MNAALLYCGKQPHNAHQGFADSISADTLHLNRSFPQKISNTIPAEVFNGVQAREYDICIAEGTRSLYGALASQIGNKSTLIYLAADQSLYDLQHNGGGNRLINKLISRFGMPLMKSLFNHYIDGIIAVSEFVAEYTKTLIDAPIKIVHPYIQSHTYERLAEVTPHIGNKTAVTVGSYSWYKGQDILPEVWSRVRKQHPNAKLNLVGNGYPRHLEDTPGINLRGYVSDLPAELSHASLYLHPARADAFPVSVLEALKAGLPAVVTTTTGTKSVVQNIQKDMIVKRSADEISTAIIDYFNTALEDRKLISQSAQTNASRFDCESRKLAFAKAFMSLCE